MSAGDISLREYLEVQIDNLKEATILAREQMDKRLESMNEFREQLKNQESEFVTKDQHENVLKELQDLRDAKNIAAGKASQSSVAVNFIISIVGLILAGAALFLKK